MNNPDTTTSALEVRDLRYPDVLFASAFGVGFLRPAPGTWGSMAAVVFWWFFLSPLPVVAQLLVCVAYFCVGWWCSTRIHVRYGIKDASQIVADEVVGMWLALAFLPPVWWVALLAFGLFRLFDIVKPGPVGWLDREVGGGLGVMADDVLAGIVAGSVLYVSIWFLLPTLLP